MNSSNNKRTQQKILITIIILLALFLLSRVIVPKLSPAPKWVNSQPPVMGTTTQNPNFVSSVSEEDARNVDPLTIPAEWSSTEYLELIKQTAVEEFGWKVMNASEGWIHFICYTPVMCFVDDLVVMKRSEADKQIDIKSASRLGYSDLDANRKRVDALRKSLEREKSARDSKP